MEQHLALGTVIYAADKGTIEVELRHARLEGTNVFYVPTLKLNWMSCARLKENGITTMIANLKCQLTGMNDRGKVVGTLQEDLTD